MVIWHSNNSKGRASVKVDTANVRHAMGRTEGRQLQTLVYIIPGHLVSHVVDILCKHACCTR